MCVCRVLHETEMDTATIWAAGTLEEEGVVATVEEAEVPCRDKIAPTENTG